MPAIERYDGSAFKVLRKFLHECPNEAQRLDIYILSAEFGLIHSAHPIPFYDRKMTEIRSQELHSSVLSKLEYIMLTKSYEELFLIAGKNYHVAFSGYESIIPLNVTYRTATGGLGKQLSELYFWLRGETSKSNSIEYSIPRNGLPKLRGIEISLTSEQVIEIARQAIAKDLKTAIRCQAWYVTVDNYQVAPKWLVSQLTGVPVSQFGTGDARRILNQLGIEVKHL